MQFRLHVIQLHAYVNSEEEQEKTVEASTMACLSSKKRKITSRTSKEQKKKKIGCYSSQESSQLLSIFFIIQRTFLRKIENNFVYFIFYFLYVQSVLSNQELAYTMSARCNLTDADRQFVARFTQLFRNGNHIEATKMATTASRVRRLISGY